VRSYFVAHDKEDAYEQDIHRRRSLGGLIETANVFYGAPEAEAERFGT